MQGHARSCNVTQGYAAYRKVMHHHAKSCEVSSSCKVKSHTPPWSTLLSCRDISPVFRLSQAVGETWLSTTGYALACNCIVFLCYVDPARRSIMMNSMNYIERHTCIKFIELNPENETYSHYVKFTTVSNRR